MRFYIANFLALRLAYSAAMELQTQIDELKASSKRQKIAIIALACVIVAGVGVAAIQPAGDATFDTITCKAWKVVDNESKLRISAGTDADGYAGVQWFDKDGKSRIVARTVADGDAGVSWWDKDGKKRIAARTLADGIASVVWLDKDEKVRISAATLADGEAGVRWSDKDGKVRIGASTVADGTVNLPTSDLKPK